MILQDSSRMISILALIKGVFKDFDTFEDFLMCDASTHFELITMNETDTLVGYFTLFYRFTSIH